MPFPDIVETERLVLRRFTLDDAPFIVELVNDEAYLRHIGDKGVRTAADARQYLREGPIGSYERFGFGMNRVELKEDGTPVGCCGLLRRESHDEVEVGFAFLAAHRGLGYGSESTAAVLMHARTTLGLRRVVAITDPQNDSSIRLLQGQGFRFESMLRMEEEDKDLKLFALSL